MGEMSAEMFMEEITIAVSTGRCPRCACVLILDVQEDDWEARCPGCKAVYGGSL